MVTRKQNSNLNTYDTASDPEVMFCFFNEIGIINQLSSTALNRRLPDGMHISHFSVLNHLIRLGDGRTPVEIARSFQVTKGTMTHTLTELEKRKLVEIKPNPADKRSKQVFLNAAGRKFQADAVQAMAPYTSKIASLLDMKQLEQLTPALEEIREVLDSHREAEG